MRGTWTYTEQLCIEHQRVGSFGEVITLEVQITQLVQVPDVQLVTLNVVVEVLNSSPSITDVHTHKQNAQPFYGHYTGQPAVTNWSILSEQSFTAGIPLLTTSSIVFLNGVTFCVTAKNYKNMLYYAKCKSNRRFV